MQLLNLKLIELAFGTSNVILFVYSSSSIMYYFSTMLFLHTLICDTGALFMKSTGPRYRRG